MLPIVYSFRRCPFAIRARMILRYASIDYELREVLLKNKPSALSAASKKATVPTMVLPDALVLDESAEIVVWALQQNDPEGWLKDTFNDTLQSLMADNDLQFKQQLDLYKYADRFPQQPQSFYRDQACTFLNKLEKCLQATSFLLNQKMSLADVYIFPFIRQFAFVDKPWFDQAPYPLLQNWLGIMLDSELFNDVMDKHSVWCEGDEAVIIVNRQEA